ncbi:MAG: LPS export ABC transporter periplasmic protein LptC [Hyphomicrobiales bacterium]
MKTPFLRLGFGTAQQSGNRGAGLARRKPMTVMLLCAIVVLTVTIVVFATGLLRVTPSPRPSNAEQDAPAPQLFTLENPSFTSFDNENHPYTIRMLSARQSEKRPGQILLKSVRGRLILDDGVKSSGASIMIVADAGIYDRETDTIDLSGNIRVTKTGDFSVSMHSARIFLRNWRLRSDDPVELTFTDGSIRADSLRICDKGRQILLFNTVRGTLSTNWNKTPSGHKHDAP